MVWGSQAKKAVIEAIASKDLAGVFSGCVDYNDVSMRSLPTMGGCNPVLFGRQDHRFHIGTKSYLDRPVQTVAVRCYENVVLRNWMGFHVVTNPDGIIDDISSRYSALALTDIASSSPANFSIEAEINLDSVFLWSGDTEFLTTVILFMSTCRS
jgi:hypothetical protein